MSRRLSKRKNTKSENLFFKQFMVPSDPQKKSLLKKINLTSPIAQQKYRRYINKRIPEKKGTRSCRQFVSSLDQSWWIFSTIGGKKMRSRQIGIISPSRVRLVKFKLASAKPPTTDMYSICSSFRYGKWSSCVILFIKQQIFETSCLVISSYIIGFPWKLKKIYNYLEDHPRTCKWLGSPSFIIHLDHLEGVPQPDP